jgi:hypothetical protein
VVIRFISMTALLLIGFTLSACVSRPTSSPAMVYVTGSLIPVPASQAKGGQLGASPLQTVTQEDLQRTGQTQLSTALRELVPQIR